MAFISEPSQQYISKDIVSMNGGTSYSATTNGTTFEVGLPATCAFKMVVTAITGNWLNLIQGSWDGTNWFTVGFIGSNGFSVGTATQPNPITATGTYYASLPCPRFIREVPTIIGTAAGNTITHSLSRHP